jgi:hypothetical protein
MTDEPDDGEKYRVPKIDEAGEPATEQPLVLDLTDVEEPAIEQLPVFEMSDDDEPAIEQLPVPKIDDTDEPAIEQLPVFEMSDDDDAAAADPDDIDCLWADLDDRMGKALRKISEPPQAPAQGGICDFLTDLEIESYAYMTGRVGIPDVDDYLKDLARFGCTQAEIEDRVNHHLNRCGSCYERFEAADALYQMSRKTFEPKAPVAEPKPEAEAPVELSQARRDSCRYSHVDDKYVARRRSSKPPSR